MSIDEPRSIALIVEADDDARTAQALIDRQLRAGADWLRDNDLDDFRSWPVIHWKSVRARCKQHNVVAHGKFEGGRRAPDAKRARDVLLLSTKLGGTEGVVLLRDGDSETSERREGLAQARRDYRHGLDAARIAIGVADPAREAWHLAGFVPESKHETEALTAESKRFGFDPTREPHRLRGHEERAIKPALERLTGGDREREWRCLDECPSERLHEHGRDCGLSEFLKELDERIVSIFR